MRRDGATGNQPAHQKSQGSERNSLGPVVLVDYVINFVGYAAYVVRAQDDSAEIVARVGFPDGRVDMKPGHACEALEEAIGQATKIGGQVSRVPFFEFVASVEDDQPIAVQFQGVGLVRDGILEFHPINQAVVFPPARRDSGGICCQLVPVIGSSASPSAEAKKPAQWDIETALGSHCAGLEYATFVEAKRRIAEHRPTSDDTPLH